jgi:hypothetical protein
MSQLGRHYEEQQGGGGGLLGSNPEAEEFGKQTFTTTAAGARGGVGGVGGRTFEGEERLGVGGTTTTTTTGAAAMAPAGGAATEATEAPKMSLAPFNDAPEGVKRVLSAVSGVLAARSMDAKCAVLGPFSRDVVVDTPFALLHRKGELRVLSYALLGALFEAARFEPAYVEYGAAGAGKSVVEGVGQIVLCPRRSLLFPPSLLLPSQVRFRATVIAGVRGPLESGLIDYVRFRPQNLPLPPAFLRSAVGGTAASALHASEPLWSNLAWLWGDNFWTARHERHRQQRMVGGGYGGYGYGEGGFGAGRVGAAGGGGVLAAAHDVSNAAIDFGSSLASRAGEYLGYFASTARHAAEAVLPEALVPGHAATATTTMGTRGLGAGYGGTTTTGGYGSAGYGGAGYGGAGYGGAGYGATGPAAATSTMAGGGMAGAPTTTAAAAAGPGGGLTGAARDVAAKGADVAHKTAAKVGEVTGMGGTTTTGVAGGKMGGTTGTTAAGGAPSYAAAAAAPESGAARRRERTAGGAGY